MLFSTVVMHIGDHVKKKTDLVDKQKRFFWLLNWPKKSLLQRTCITFLSNFVNESLRKFFLSNSVICRKETELKPVKYKKKRSFLESWKRKPSVSRECWLKTYNVQLLDFYHDR